MPQVLTRFRDVPFEEAMTCRTANMPRRERWEPARGKRVVLNTPPTTEEMYFSTCRVHYESDWITPDGRPAYVCEHLVEIGD